ncbi:MAG TPA: FtsK/SpoIIIE domain-containing protein, partial [Jatrophihabitantaceae bacterium]
MRIDLTVRADDGSERDVAITAPAGSRFASIAPALARAVPGVRAEWCGRRQIDPNAVVGDRELRSGAVLTEGPREPAERAGTRLEIVGGVNAGRGIALELGGFELGRAPGCALVLADPRVSRHHARVTTTLSRVSVRDLGSTHGSYLDGAVVEDERALPPGSILRIGDTFLAVTAPAEALIPTRPRPDGTVLVTRSRRGGAVPERRVIDMPSDPDAGPRVRVPWVTALVPALAGGALALGMHSMKYLAFAALGPVAFVLAAVVDRLRGRSTRQRSRASHRRRVEQAERDIAAGVSRELTIRRAAHPDPASLLRTGRGPGAGLWHRRRGDVDLLRLRVGLASRPSMLAVSRDSATAPAAQLPAVPVLVDLAAGPVGVAAPPEVRRALARWLVAQLAVQASPADVELVLLVGDDAEWSWTRWLPHLRGRVAHAGSGHGLLIDDLVETARLRRDGGLNGPWRGPWLVLVIDPVTGPIVDRLDWLLSDGAAVGISALCFADHAEELPAACTHVIDAAGDSGATLRVSDNTGGAAAQVIADRVGTEWSEQLARALAPLRDAAADTSLPTQCRLADLIDSAAPAAESIRRTWQTCDGAASTILGVGTDGVVRIDLDRDGPHALIAGTTGSGKSELLQALIVGLAARYPPELVTFLLIDYKGGAAFARCSDLPHTIGVVTDFDEHLTQRVLASLDSEIRRREMLLAAAGAADRADYCASGGILPRLVLIVDEFATLATELAGFVPALVGIAQRGRSLGVHLVLATQRPAGVVSPEIRANTALRVALRTTSAADSVDVIDSPEAVAIDRRTPGRAFVRLGTAVHAVQCAHVACAEPPNEVSVDVLDAWRQLPQRAGDGPTDLDRFVREIRAAAAGHPPPRQPWLPPLPGIIAIGDLPAAPPPHVAVGLVDRPDEQRQEPLLFDLRAGGAILLVGSPRSGRSSALVSVGLAAARQCAPPDLHLHTVDGSGTGLRGLGKLPHIGTAAGVPDGFALVARLVERLEAEFARRRSARHAGRAEPALLLLIDDWEAVTAASEQHDGGRTVERLLTVVRDAAAAGATVVVSGGRAALAPRLSALAGSRFVLRMNDAADYAQAGVDPRAFPVHPPPGRAIRVADAAEVQFAFPGDARAQEHAAAQCAAQWPDPAPSRLRLRNLPTRVRLGELRRTDGWLLGVGGDDARPISVDLTTGARRMLVAGPPRSGRSTVLCSILRQAGRRSVLVAAPDRSPVAAGARESGFRLLTPASPFDAMPRHDLLLIDDCETFTDTALGDALLDEVRRADGDHIVVASARSDVAAVSFRGVAAALRLSGAGVLLRPGPLDGELLGVSLPRARPDPVAGRGVLVPDPAWHLGAQ